MGDPRCPCPCPRRPYPCCCPCPGSRTCPGCPARAPCCSPARPCPHHPVRSPCPGCPRSYPQRCHPCCRCSCSRCHPCHSLQPVPRPGRVRPVQLWLPEHQLQQAGVQGRLRCDPW